MGQQKLLKCCVNLTIYLLVVSADNLCKHFGPRKNVGSDLEPKRFDIGGTPAIIFRFFSLFLEKKQQATNKHEKLPSRQRVLDTSIGQAK